VEEGGFAQKRGEKNGILCGENILWARKEGEREESTPEPGRGGHKNMKPP